MGEAIAYWSIMSSGSWAGEIGGAEPSGFSPYAKEYLQTSLGGNWLKGTSVHIDDIDSKGIEVLLDQASSKGTNNDVLRIDLPDKEVVINEPFEGDYEYFSGSGDELNNSMIASVDLSNAADAKLTFKTWYQIEQDWDYASVQVKEDNKWVAIQGNLTTDSDPHSQNPGFGITGHSDGWVDAEFDLTDYAGKAIELRINYWTDVAAAEAGFYVDELNIMADDKVVLYDGAEDESEFVLKGFKKDSGKFSAEHYYLIEWRNHQGVDMGLKHIARGVSLMQYDPGMVVWYVDNSYSNNWVGNHPGDGFLGVVDADQHALDWSDKAMASSRYQIHDAAFSLEKASKMYLSYPGQFTMTDNYAKAIDIFDDGNEFINDEIPDFGRNIPSFDLKIRVTGESSDRSVGKIFLFR
jgi:immune inhibitor A